MNVLGGRQDWAKDLGEDLREAAALPEIALVVPPVPGSGGAVDAAVLWAARELGLENVFRANGPAGIAALAFGTETFPRVRKVVGPGHVE